MALQPIFAAMTLLTKDWKSTKVNIGSKVKPMMATNNSNQSGANCMEVSRDGRGGGVFECNRCGRYTAPPPIGDGPLANLASSGVETSIQLSSGLPQTALGQIGGHVCAYTCMKHAQN